MAVIQKMGFYKFLFNFMISTHCIRILKWHFLKMFVFFICCVPTKNRFNNSSFLTWISCKDSRKVSSEFHIGTKFIVLFIKKNEAFQTKFHKFSSRIFEIRYSYSLYLIFTTYLNTPGTKFIKFGFKCSILKFKMVKTIKFEHI